MPVPQYRSIGPVTITNCTEEELASLRGAVSRADSRVRCLILHVDCDQDETGGRRGRTVRFTANGLERLSTLMWSKQLGIPRAQQLITPCTKGVEQAMDECRAQLDLDFESQEQFGGVSKHCRAQLQVTESNSNSNSNKRKAPPAPPPSAPAQAEEQQQQQQRSGNPSLYRQQLEQLSVEHRAQLRHEQQRSGTWVDPDIPPKPLMFPTLYEYLMVMRFEPSVGPPTPEFAWHRFHGWSREWYLLHKVPAGNETHMGTVCRLMREHPASKPGWLRLLAVKEAERESDKQVLTTKRPLRPPHAGLVQYLRGRRFNPPGFFHDKMHAEAWESFKAWGAEWCLDHPEEGLDEADMHNSLIEAMYMHKDGHRKWCAHACKQNVWPPTGDGLGDRPGDYGDRELE